MEEGDSTLMLNLHSRMRIFSVLFDSQLALQRQATVIGNGGSAISKLWPCCDFDSIDRNAYIARVGKEEGLLTVNGRIADLIDDNNFHKITANGINECVSIFIHRTFFNLNSRFVSGRNLVENGEFQLQI